MNVEVSYVHRLVHPQASTGDISYFWGYHDEAARKPNVSNIYLSSILVTGKE